MVIFLSSLQVLPRYGEYTPLPLDFCLYSLLDSSVSFSLLWSLRIWDFSSRWDRVFYENMYNLFLWGGVLSRGVMEISSHGPNYRTPSGQPLQNGSLSDKRVDVEDEELFIDS